ncbi:MAG: beta strand repeat-containing protein [Rhodospirillales bacterium]
MATYKDLFNESFYLAQNADVAAAIKSGAFKGSAFDHYNSFGFREGRDPNALFDSSFYLLNNVDVFQAGINPLEHYFSNGGFEGRDPSPFFDSSYYLATNFDVANALVNPLLHFIQNGGKEGRDPSTGFDSSKYLADNPDVAAAGVNPLIHYLQFGQNEGRKAFDASGNVITGQPTIPDSGNNPTLVFETTADTLSGTTGNDTGQADLRVSPEGLLLGTLQSSDNANFGAGYDILTVTANGSVEFGIGLGPRATLTSLEEIQVEPITKASNVDMASTTGLEKVQVNRAGANLTINNIASALTGGIQINNPVNGGATQNFNFIDSVLSGTTDAITVTLNSADPILNNFGAITIASQNGSQVMETATVVSQGNATTNVLANIVGGTAALNLVLNSAALTITNDTTHTTVDVVGSKNFTATGELLGATTITAGTFTGNFVANVDDSIGVNVTTGTGNDTVDFSDDAAGYGALGTASVDTWSAGAGTDRIILRNGDVVGNAALTQSQTNITAVEEGQVQDALNGSAVLQHFNSVGINTWFFNGGNNDGAGETINFSSATVTMTLGADFGDQLTVNHTAVTGSDSLVFNMNADIGDGAGENLIFTGWEGITINTSGTTDNSGGTAVSAHEISGDLRATTTGAGPTAITLTGSSNFEIVGSSDVAVIDGTGFTGRLIMSTTNGTDLSGFAGLGTGAAVTGGSGNDAIVGNGTATLADTLVGGGGNDVILGTISNDGTRDNQGDTLTGNAGTDTFVFQGATAADVYHVSAGTTRVTAISDFVAGTDKIALVNDAAAFTTFVLANSQNIATAANLTDVYAGVSAIAASTANIVQGAYITVLAGALAGKTYLYVNDATAGVSNADDMLIDLTGISGTFTANDVVFGYTVA